MTYINFSNKRNIIYLHPPKTAGKSLEKVFFNVTPRNASSNHLKLSTMKRKLKGDINLSKNWDVIISVRNPWDRLVSNYHQGNSPHSVTKQAKPEKNISFKDYIMKKDRVEFFPPQMDWLILDGITTPTYIIRFESLQSDYNKIPREFRHDKHKDVDELPKLNPSNHKHYTTYYDDESREKVAQDYREDISYFRYTFK